MAWDEWITQVTAALNFAVNKAVSELPHFIKYGADRKLPYDILNENPDTVYNYVST